MIKGVHAMFFSSDPAGTRAFLKDKLQLPHTDVGDGWLIFDAPAGDVGVHPTDGSPASGTHSVSFWCDDVKATVAEMKSKGVEFDSEIEDQGFGLITRFTMPGGIQCDLYEPRYTKSAS